MMKKSNFKALLPIGVFLVLYLGLGILFEYILKIPMGFYNIPIVVIFLAALFVACVQNPKLSFDNKLEIMAKGVGNKNIITMILIFMMAGVFVGVVGRSSAQSVAYFVLSFIPARFSVLVLFIVSAFVSLAMGTSVGTITLIAPIGIAVAQSAGFGLPMCLGAVVGGAMFGDNLSFISDTTIAACNGQGCAMKDKFKANLWIALPAAVVTAVFVVIRSMETDVGNVVLGEYNLVQIIPYIIVLIGGIIGINVFVVLLIGIVSGAAIMLITGASSATEMLVSMGTGVSGMFETAMVAILVSAICALIEEYGGFMAVLELTKKIFKGRKGGKFGMGLLAGLIDIATANNTVAIVMANPIAREMADNYDISPKKAASLLDTFSCIFQGIIPYGAQLLVAVSVASDLGFAISSIDIIPHLIYPFMLFISSLIFIFILPDRDNKS